ncbi:hypothetical protein [Streptomyces sp. WMMC905]|uniref:hypothetical protein n=1 Tax=Streptomyces sp. WMMC905 TaxID=3404123 RepID=UPI003B924E96
MEEAADRAYSRDVSMVQVVAMIPPLSFCAAMVVGAVSDAVALAVLRYFLGPAIVVATIFMVTLIVKYEASSKKDFSIAVTVFGGTLLNSLTGFATGSFFCVSIPLVAPLSQWILSRVRVRRKGRK